MELFTFFHCHAVLRLLCPVLHFAFLASFLFCSDSYCTRHSRCYFVSLFFFWIPFHSVRLSFSTRVSPLFHIFLSVFVTLERLIYYSFGAADFEATVSAQLNHLLFVLSLSILLFTSRDDVHILNMYRANLQIACPVSEMHPSLNLFGFMKFDSLLFFWSWFYWILVFKWKTFKRNNALPPPLSLSHSHFRSFQTSNAYEIGYKRNSTNNDE